MPVGLEAEAAKVTEEPDTVTPASGVVIEALGGVTGLEPALPI